MRYIFILLFFSVNVFSFNYLQKIQNKDGSFGSQEKEILTSITLIALLAHGETTTSKHHGEIVKNSMIYLANRAKEFSKNDKIGFKDIYVLWALSEAYAMTGVAVLEDSSEELCSHVLKFCNENEWVDLNKTDYSNFNNILSLAFYSARLCGLEATEGVDFTSMMKSVIQNAKALSPMDLNDIAVLKLIQLRWQIDSKDLYLITPLKKKYTEAELDQVADISKRLNGDSKARKKAFIEAGNLSPELKALLIEKLSNSEIIELSETAKELQRKIILSLELNNWQDYFEASKNSPFKMFPVTVVYFFKGGEEWKNWNKPFQKHLTRLQKPEGVWPEELEVPNFLKLKGKDKELFNTAFAALNLTIYYRYLPGLKFPVKRRPAPIMEEEEGLDLVE